MDRATHLSATDNIYVTVHRKNVGKGRQMVLLEQNSVGRMEELAGNFSKLVELVAVLFSGTFATAKACLELLRYHRFVG